MKKEDKLVVFEDKQIRRVWYNNKWFYSVSDIISVLTKSQDSKAYWRKLKQREPQLVTICHGLKLKALDGKLRIEDCVDTKNAFRLIQSIPSKRAEPFKMWLAQLGQDRIDEIENPELAQNRVKEYYELKGYPKDWIDKRLRGIAIRQDLTGEWKDRGIENKKDFAILTNEIHKATFDVSIKKHKEIKNIPKQSKSNLRDNMTDLELIFNMLSERATTEITRTNNSSGFEDLSKDAQKGGKIAKISRLELEKETGKKVVSRQNHLDLRAKKLESEDKKESEDDK